MPLAGLATTGQHGDMANGRLVVLGAGASRAAASANNLRVSCQPPLNADFFTQLQRIVDPKHKKVIESCLGDVVEIFGSNFELTLEDYFTQLEFFTKAVDLTSRNPDLDREYFLDKRENLMAALAAVLEASTGQLIRDEGCALHNALVDTLQPGDTVISFNYDCLMDYALKTHGDGKWNPRWGYAFPLRRYTLTGEDNWSPDSPASRPDDTIMLLKVHGSLNWQLPTTDEGEIRLKQRVHRQRGTPRFTIVPPIWNKTFEGQPIFRKVWQEAASRLRAAKTVSVVGFSFVPTDLYAQSLFQVAYLYRKGKRRSHALKRLVIANPDQTARQRVRYVFDVPLLNQGVLVRQYEGFSDFVEALPEAFD